MVEYAIRRNDTKEFLLRAGETWLADEKDSEIFAGTSAYERVLVERAFEDGGHPIGWKLTTDQYYFAKGKIEMVITHDLERALAIFSAVLDADQKAEEGTKPKPRLPSEWAKEGYYVIEGWTPKVGADLDYYDRDGIKRQGRVKYVDAGVIVIDGYRQTTVEETFKVRHGR